ncbi:hypothetical protein [Micromonospora avicenniae]|uniref:hypothetical protein n=1 Tax=Micromonospora avicenniae TaxID=1198245 RepID=UPI0034420C2D
MARLWQIPRMVILRVAGWIARGLVSVGECGAPVLLLDHPAPEPHANRLRLCRLRDRAGGDERDRRYGSLGSAPRRTARRPPGRNRTR